MRHASRVRRLLDVPEVHRDEHEVLAVLGLDLQLRAGEALLLQRVVLGRAPPDREAPERGGDRRDGQPRGEVTERKQGTGDGQPATGNVGLDKDLSMPVAGCPLPVPGFRSALSDPLCG